MIGCMTTMIAELREALVAAGAPEKQAEAAAAAVAGAGETATKADLAALETRMAWRDARMVRWVTVLVLGANALLFAALRLTG